MPEYALTVSGLAEGLGISRQSINELLRERRAHSPEMALRLWRLFGNAPEFWLNARVECSRFSVQDAPRRASSR